MTAATTYVRAKYNFAGKNNDELCFAKNDVIVLTQQPDGGWWEGTLSGKTGWFPSNYVIIEAKEVAPTNQQVAGQVVTSDKTAPSRALSPLRRANKDVTLKEPPNALITTEQRVGFRETVVEDLIKAERKHVQELDTLSDKYLQLLKNLSMLVNLYIT